MQGWTRALLPPAGTIREAIQIIDKSGAQICLVADEQRRLLGTITDGDIRRSLLKAVSLDAAATEIMQRKPIVARPSDGPDHLRQIMQSTMIRQVPILDDRGVLVGLVTFNELTSARPVRDNWVVLMAGGLGNRLRPLTEDTPKPLLKVGQKPLLETIIEAFLQCDFQRFYVAVNYRAERIKEYFGTGKHWNCEIRYLEERDQLGTAGAIGLIDDKPTQPLIVMNGDVLTRVNFGSLLDFHREQRASATMCVRAYDFQVPYGVVNIRNSRIEKIVEKPVHAFFVNAGIYVLEPDALDFLPSGQRFDMTDLFDRLIQEKRNTAAFPIREYWIDIGRLDDFERANGEFGQNFE